MKGLLIGESADTATTAEIRETLQQRPEIQRITELRSQHLGPETLLVAAKIVFTPELSSAETARAISDCEAAIKSVFPEVAFVYLVPEVGP